MEDFSRRTAPNSKEKMQNGAHNFGFEMSKDFDENPNITVKSDTNIDFKDIDLSIKGSMKSDTEEDEFKKADKPRWKRVLTTIGYVIGLLVCLYFFICSLDLMSTAFRLIAGSASIQLFTNSWLLRNPIAGLVIGILLTIAVQSSSTSTSILITMVASEIIRVKDVVYMIMGANIGTSITNTLVSMGNIGNRKRFGAAFAGATVHDVFNWLSVLILLPIEAGAGYLNWLSGLIVDSMHLSQYKAAKQDLLKTITKPLTNVVVQIDSKLLADSKKLKKAGTLMKWCCKWVDVPSNISVPLLNITSNNETDTDTDKTCNKKCVFMFIETALVWADPAVGGIVLFLSLTVLIACLIGIVKILQTLLQSQVSATVKKVVNSQRLGCFTGYLAILVGLILTILVQSSSVFTSAITPLVGSGFLSLDLMFALSLGSNIGTTVTGVLAALATDNSTIALAMQAAMMHLFFNITGIIIWYPIPHVRAVPLAIAKRLGKSTANYRWFAALYLIMIFIIFPFIVFGLSMIHIIAAGVVVGIIILLALIVGLIKILQIKRPQSLPPKMRDWKSLPRFMRSLRPYDNVMTKVFRVICCCCKKTAGKLTADDKETAGNDNLEIEIKDENYITSL